MFSHSNPCGVFNHPRNITDEQIRACASRDGVVGIVGWAPIVNRENDASPEAVLEHVLYVSELVGPRHVAIGLDYVYDPGLTTRRVKAHPEIYTPDGGTFEDWNYHHDLQEFAAPSIFVPLTELLLDRGFTGDEIRGILGQNWHRVLRANWAE